MIPCLRAADAVSVRYYFFFFFPFGSFAFCCVLCGCRSLSCKNNPYNFCSGESIWVIQRCGGKHIAWYNTFLHWIFELRCLNDPQIHDTKSNFVYRTAKGLCFSLMNVSDVSGKTIR